MSLIYIKQSRLKIKLLVELIKEKYLDVFLHVFPQILNRSNVEKFWKSVISRTKWRM